MAAAKKEQDILVVKPSGDKNGDEMSYNGIVFSSSSKVVNDEGIYNIDILPEDLDEVDEFKDDVAYLNGDYYYLYRGIGNIELKEGKKPGIYRNKHARPKFFLVEPDSDEEKAEYNIKDNVVSVNPVSIIDSANNKEDLLIAIPESSKVFQPPISEKDDILKLIAKKVLLAKNVDLDRRKDRFANKNELFNFKQVIRGDTKLSMRIFNREMDALNLKYEIKVSEKTTNDIIGDPLMEPIVVSSEETYVM